MVKKAVAELTDEEAIRRLFPKRVVEEAKREAEKAERQAPEPTKRPAKSAGSV